MTATLHTAGHMGLPVVDFAELVPTQAIAAAAHTLKNVALFAVAPFIGLAYAVTLPFVGLAMLAWIGMRALVKAPVAYKALIAARNVALFVAAPLIGLVYAVTLPFVGLALMARVAYQAYRAPVLVA